MSITAPLNSATAKRETRARLRQEFRPQTREIKRRKRMEKNQQKGVQKAFKQHGRDIETSRGNVQAGYDAARNAVNQTGKGISDYAENLRRQMASEGMADAQRRGTTYRPGTDVLSGQAQIARLGTSGVMSGVIGSQGASQNAYMADRGRIAAREAINQRQQSNDRMRGLAVEQQRIKRDRADKRNILTDDQRAREREYELATRAAGLDDRRFEHQVSEDRKTRSGTKSTKPGTSPVRKAVAQLTNNISPESTNSKAVEWLVEKGYTPKEAKRAVARWRKTTVTNKQRGRWGY